MRKRTLGTTGESLSVIGFGGVVVKNEPIATANRLVAQAIERGINYFDVAPNYGDAQERLGEALSPYRSSVFLACKTTARTQEKAAHELRDSLTKLRTDHVDLYQLHGVTSTEEVELILGPGGALEAFVKARDEGLVRYLGFSAHSEEAALALLDGFAFTSMLFPINWFCWNKGGFGPRAVKKAQEKKVGILGLKAMARRNWLEGEERKWPKCWYAPFDDPHQAQLAVRFALSQPITATVGPGEAELLWMVCDSADTFQPISDEEIKQLEQLGSDLEPIFPKEISA